MIVGLLAFPVQVVMSIALGIVRFTCSHAAALPIVQVSKDGQSHLARRCWRCGAEVAP